ncbi:MAG: protoporphyrinogen oxidase HemJ [Pseudomonadota bacterium]
MLDAIAPFYNWIKVLHILAVIAWMAGLMYLPRLFVYHTGAKPGGELSETLKVMERRLLKGIMNPAMVAVWLFGGLLLAVQWSNYAASAWFAVKFVFVAAITGLHHYYVRIQKAFAEDRNVRSAKHYKILNEAPFVFLIVIVIMVIVKPF